MEFKIKLSESSRLRRIPEYLSEKAIALKQRYKEHKIAKNFEIHDFTIEGNTIDDVYNMREPIAKFAKKYNIKIDVYDPRTVVEVGGIQQSHHEVDAKKYFHVIFTDLENNKNIDDIIPARNDIFYPKVSKSKYLCKINGEQDLEIIRDVVSTREDTCLKNFFRELENGVKEIMKRREKEPKSGKFSSLFI